MLTISCIPSSFCSFIIINRKMAGEMLEVGIPTPFHWAFPSYFSVNLLGVHVYIVAADAFALSLERHSPASDVVRCTRIARTCVLNL